MTTTQGGLELPGQRDPNTIFVGAPGDPLANQHIDAHQQIKDELILADGRITNHDAEIAALKARGNIARITNTALVNCGVNTTIMTMTVDLIVGNAYRVHGRAGGTQRTVNSTGTLIQISAGLNVTFRIWQLPSLIFAPTGQGPISLWGASEVFRAVTGVGTQFIMAGTTQGGVFEVPVGLAVMSIDHLGPDLVP